MKRKKLAEQSADRVEPECRKSYIKGYMSGAAAQVRYGNKISEKLKKKWMLNAVEYFGCYLIDNHESKFPGGEREIQELCNDVLNLIKSRQ